MHPFDGDTHLLSVPTIKPECLQLLDTFEISACVLRNEQFVLIWCNDAYARLCKKDKLELIGSRMSDFISEECAAERELAFQKTLDNNQMLTVMQFGSDERQLCSFFPIDEEEFGHRGVLAMIQPAPTNGALQPRSIDMLLQTSCLDDMAVLSTAEMRVMYHIARGLSTKEIASELHRSERTIENHIGSIHAKLNTSSRAQLVKYAVDRGIHGFPVDHWEYIITGKAKPQITAASA